MNSSSRVRLCALASALAGLAVLAVAASPVGAVGSAFQTTQPAMITPLAPGSSVTPIITVGEKLASGYEFEAIPDGIALRRRGDGTADVFVNHELSTVPFQGGSDFFNSILSKLQVNRNAEVLAGEYAIPSSANYQRFCSNFLAGAAQGFEREILFTNEETSDSVNRTGQAFPPGPSAEQAGVVVAYDVQAGTYRSLYSTGRMNHENSVALRGYGHPVVITGDDTFTAPSSQLYMATAPNAATILADNAVLWAFQSDNPNVNDYSDLSGSATAKGNFLQVPEAIARGNQTGLENWSNANNVFQFIRVEDIAQDRNHSNVFYFADTGEPRAKPGPGAARMTREPSTFKGPFPNGRVFKMVLDRRDPTIVRSLSILIEGDPLGADSAGNTAFIHNPDNLETTDEEILVTEDPGSQNSYAASDPNGTTARIWRYGLGSASLSVVAKVNQAKDPAARQGAWESSGIVDASRIFGEGAFLVDVQAHTLIIHSEVRNGVLFKQEGGQLLLFRMSRDGQHGN